MTGAPGGERGPGRDRSGLQVPADLAHQHRRRPQAAVGDDRHRASTSTTATSTASTTSTPTCRPRSRRSPAPTTVRAGPGRPARRRRPGPCATRLNNAAGQPDHQRHRAEEPEHRPVVEPRGQPRQDARRPASRSRGPTATASRGTRSMPGSVAVRVVHQQRDQRRSQQPRPRRTRATRRATACSSRRPYSKQYFGFGGTTVSAFWEARTIGNASYVFSGDMNGDTASNNDLIYIHRDQSEMNFVRVHGRAAARSPPPSRRRRGTPTSRRTRI